MAESLRSRTFGELFTLTFTVFFKCLGRLLTVQMVFWVPIVALVGLGTALLLGSGLLQTEEHDIVLAIVLAGAFFVLIVIALVLGPIQSAVSMIVIADHILGQRTPLSTAFGIAFKKVIGFIAISLVYVLPWILPAMLFGLGAALGPDGALLMGLGGVLLVVATVFSFVLFAMFFVAGPVLVLEQTGPGDALRRSRVLTKGHRWTVLGLFIIVSFIAGMAVNFIAVPLNLFTTFVVKSEVGQIAGSLLSNGIQQILGGAFGGVLTVLLYFDLRVKKDGFDIENLAELVDVIAARESAPRAGAGASEAAPAP